jgi:phosphonate transport system substrate-binding protein
VHAQESTLGAGTGVLSISAIPDQDVAVLNRQFGTMAEYLAEATGLTVEYVPMVDYAALVTAFERGDIQLAWFGGLTGVQAQAAVDGARAVAQRPRDAEFHSRFIVRADLEDVDSLEDLKGKTFTFGSESSTSGHLMPRYFLVEAGVDPDADFQGLPNYSGSHDTTIALVESGAFDAGALNEAVWEQRLADGEIDTTRVRDFYTSPAYYDYHWGVRPDLDATLGDGATELIVEAILALDATDPDQKAILDLFSTDSFIETLNANYDTIRDVAEGLGILR